MLVLMLVVGSTRLLSAQAWEGYLFAGANGHGTSVFDAKMPSGGTYGGKLGYWVDDNLQLDGNLSWYGHFGLSAPDSPQIFRFSNELDIKTRALLWEFSGTYNFGEHKVGYRFTPYVTVGIGG